MTQFQSLAAFIKRTLATFWARRLFLSAVFVALLLCSFGAISFMPQKYRVGANLLIVNGNSRSDPTLQPPDLPAIAMSAQVLQRVRSKYGLSIPIRDMKSRLSAKAPPFKSGIMRLEYTDTTPVRAATIANAVADELARTYERLSKSRYVEDVHDLDGELSTQRKRIERFNAILVAHGESAEGPTVDEKGTPVVTGPQTDSLPSLRFQRTIANAALQVDVAHLHAVTVDAAIRRSLLRHDLLQNDPVYRSLQTDADAAAAQVAKLRAQYTSEYAGLRPIKAKATRLHIAAAQEAQHALASSDRYSPATIAALTAQRNAEALVIADRAKVDALNQEIGSMSKPTKDAAAMVIVRLQRDASLAAYRAIAARLATSLADRADVLSLGSVVVVDRASALDAQSSVSTKRLMIAFALVALVLALIATYIAEELDPRLRRVTQIETLYGMPVIATLGTANQKSGVR